MLCIILEKCLPNSKFLIWNREFHFFFFLALHSCRECFSKSLHYIPSILFLFSADCDTKRPPVERKHSRNLSVSSARLAFTSEASLPRWDSVDSNVDRIDQVNLNFQYLKDRLYIIIVLESLCKSAIKICFL